MRHSAERDFMGRGKDMEPQHNNLLVALVWTNAGSFSIGPFGTNLSKNWLKIQHWRKYSGLNVLAATIWWRHQMETFSVLLAICVGIHRSPVNSPHKGQWRGALMFSLICVWINGWVNNREAGELRRYRAHCDVSVMLLSVLPYMAICEWQSLIARPISCEGISIITILWLPIWP